MALAYISPTIEGRKRLGVAKLKDDLRARYPVGAIAVDKMADDIEGGPTSFTLVAECLGFRQIAQKRIESHGSAAEKRDGVLQVVFHHALDSWTIVRTF